MKNAIGGIALIIGLVVAPFSSRVQAASIFVISEIQTASTASASDEYIQISNTSAYEVDISGWRLEYFSANPKSFSAPSRTIKLSGKVTAGADFIAASNGYMADSANIFYAATLASSGGHIRLASGDITMPVVYDLVGWGSAVKPETSAATAPKSGEILTRVSNTNGHYVDTDNNQSDFTQDSSLLHRVPNVYSTEVIITELLPNPASPVADSVGEYVELHNSSVQPISLRGYKILTGNSLTYSYVFKDQQLAPGEYKSFYATETHAALSNSGGKVQLQAPDGAVVDETDSYTAAPEGQAWALDGISWQWTSIPTPNAQNMVVTPTESSPSKVIKKPSTKLAKKPSTKKATAKVKAASTVTPKKAVPTGPTPTPMHATVLAGVGGLAVLYGVYEYRQDIATAIRKLRGNRGNRS